MRLASIIALTLAFVLVLGVWPVLGQEMLFKQCDPRWGSKKLDGITTKTICEEGGIVSSVAMVLRAKGLLVNGQPATPLNLDNFLKTSNGYFKDGSIKWGAFHRVGLSYKARITERAHILKAIQRNDIVILNVNHQRHWVLAKENQVSLNSTSDESLISVLDPAFTKSTYLFSEVSAAAVYSPAN